MSDDASVTPPVPALPLSPLGRRYGMIRSPKDHQDMLMAVAAPSTLKDVDLRAFAPPARDQGQESSCTGFSLAAMMEVMAKQGDPAMQPIITSPAFIYYEERLREGAADQDAGGFLRDGLKVLQKMGVPSESAMPYVVGQYATPPSPEAITEAASHRITRYARVNGAIGIQTALNQGHPVILGIEVYSSFENTPNTGGSKGVVAVPNLRREELLGGHAILCVGWMKDLRFAGGSYYILLNSWGLEAGDNGYFYYPAACVTKKLTPEAWVAFK